MILWIDQTEEEKGMKLDWESLIHGSLSRKEIEEAIGDPKWQQVRILMLGKPLGVKYHTLRTWLKDGPGLERKRQIQVTNYVNALKRGGLVK